MDRAIKKYLFEIWSIVINSLPILKKEIDEL